MLTGKTAIVTGGGRGIGAAISKKLAGLGAGVAIVYAGNELAAAGTAAECGPNARVYRCDAADFLAVKAAVAQIRQDFGGVDILVNNAGINRDGLLAMDKTAFERVKLSRANDRPTGRDYLTNLLTDFLELHGDRRFADDPAIVAGIGFLGGRPVTAIAIEKGHGTRERLARNFGSPSPEGYRKALRLMNGRRCRRGTSFSMS